MATITLIAALDQKCGIGLNGELPWRLPADLKRFKKRSMGKAMIMGRKTCESIGRALPGRTSIVLSRNKELHIPENCQLANGVEQSLQLANQASQKLGSDEIMIIGGAQIYALFMPLADTLELTWVQSDSGADCFLTSLDMKQWTEVSREEYPADARNPLAMSFVRYQARKS